MASPSDVPAPLPHFLVWLRSTVDGRPEAQLFFDADGTGKQPVLTREQNDRLIRFVELDEVRAQLSLAELARVYPWREAA